MRKLVALGLTLVVLVGALLVAPRFVDPAAYRDIILAELHRAIGRDIAIAGPLTFSLLPTPHLTAAEIRLADGTAGGGKSEILRAAWLEARLAPLPLLTGRIVLRNVTLIDPVLDLAAPEKSLPEKSMGADWRQAVATEGLQIDTLRIVNGTLLYRAGGASERVDTIDLDLARTPAGALHVAGSFRTRSVSPSFTLDLDHADRPGGFGLAVTLTRPAAHLEMSGEIAATPDGGYSVDAPVKATSDDLAAVLARTGLSQWVPGRKLAATAHLKADAKSLKLDELSLTLDETRGDGSVAIDGPGGIAAALRFNRIDFDRLMAAAPFDAAGLMAPPAALRGKLDLSAAAVDWRGGVIRDALLQAHAADGAAALDRLSGILPGNSTIALDGQAAVADGKPEFRGTLEAGSDNLRELLRWLGADPQTIPADRLRKAVLTSRFTAHADRVDIGDVDLTIDASRLTGAATLALRRRIAFGARLSVDQLNLDAYWPNTWSGTGFFAGFDANIDATVATLTWHGQPARGLHAAAVLQNGDLTLREVSIADLADASGSASGLITGIGGKDMSWKASVAAKGSELAHVIRLVAPGLDFAWRLGGPFSVSGDLANEPGATAVDLGVAALGGTLHLSGGIGAGDAPDLDLSFEATHPSLPRLARTLGITYQPAGGDPGALKATGKLHRAPGKFGIDDVAATLGALTIGGSIDLDLTKGRPLATASLTFGDLAIDRFLPLRQTALIVPDHLIHLAATGVAAGSVWSSAPIDLAMLNLGDANVTLHGDKLTYGAAAVAQPQATLALRNGTVKLDGLGGTLLGGALSGSATLASAGKDAQATLALRGIGLKALLAAAAGTAPLDGTADLDVKLATHGGSAAELVTGLNGEAKLTGGGGTLTGIDLTALSAKLDRGGPTDIFALARGLGGGSTPYQSIAGSFRITDGIVLSDDLAIVAADAAALARVAIDLPGWLLQSRVEFRLTGHPDAPPFAVSLDGRLESPRTVFDINAMEAYLTHRGAPPSP